MKVDFKKQLESYTAPYGRFSLVRVTALSYLMVDGHGDPNTTPAYAQALAALYPLAYAVKFLSKTELGRDYVVMPLEALWWSADMASFTTARDKSRWDWTLLNLVPEWITREHVETARETAAKRTGAGALHSVRLEHHDEGLSVQTLHIGPYDDEAPVLARMHTEFIPAQSLRLAGKHHEIYLSDPRRTAAARLKTILRQPVTEGPSVP